MKKFLVLIMVVLMVFAMVACKSEPEKESVYPVEKEAGQDALLEQGSSAKAIDHTGFKISVSATTGGEAPISFEIGGKDDIYWISVTGGVSVLVRDFASATYMFFPMEAPANSFWLKIADKSLKEEIFDETVDAILYSIYNNEDYLTKQGTETKSGRACTKYTVSVQEFGYNYTVWVDNEFGFTVALEASAGSESLSYSMTPKLSNLVEGDLPANYAKAKACNLYTDTPAL